MPNPFPVSQTFSSLPLVVRSMSRQASPPSSPSALSALNVKLGVSDDESSAKRRISPRFKLQSKPSKLTITDETTGQSQEGGPIQLKKLPKIAALCGDDEMNSPKKRFRNCHASFRLRMLQEQHGPAQQTAAPAGTGFEPVGK